MVSPVMAGDRSPQRPRDEGKAGPGANQAWAAISYLIGGILVWGFAGWLIDRWLDTGGIATAIGAVVGAAGGVYLIARRLGR
jgi:F0F1-type ATP synthase assembly protein I